MPQSDVCKIEIFIPTTHLNQIRDALASVDAGHIGVYDCCMSYSPVTGCWRPLAGSSPYIGTENTICEQAEYKVEVCCLLSRLPETLAAIRSAHPYEEPVINVIPLLGTGMNLS